jgi:PAS domain-containing protein/anti-sigma regulatory factor (Ser/Thr protein kinase)
MTETTAGLTTSPGPPGASGHEAIAVVDRDLRYVGVSAAFAEMTGIPATDHVGRPVDELGGEVVVRSVAAIRSVLNGGEPVGEAIDDDEPGRRRFRRSVVPLPGPDGDVAGAILVIAEVTPEADARLDAAEARAEVGRERERLLAVLRSMPSGVAVADAATSTMVLANEPFERIAGASFPGGTQIAAANGLRGFRADGSVYAADDWPLVRSMTSGEVVTNEQIRLERPDGTSVVVEASSAPTRDRSGAITGGVVVMHDVTNRRRADTDREQLLRRITEERILLLEVLARMQAGVLVTLPDEVVLTNDAFGAAWRYPVEQVMRASDLEGLVAVGADDRPIQTAGWPNVRAQTTGTVVGPEDLQVVRGDGSRGIIEAAAAPLRDAMGEVIGSVTVVQDVTEQRLATKQERQLLELAASLAGAHTAAEVEEGSLEWLIGSTGAIRAGLALAEDEQRGRSVRLLRRRSAGGPADEVVRLAADRRTSPAERTTRTGRPLTFPTTAALLERFPEVADAVRGLDGEARAFVPLRASGETLGTATLAFAEAREIGEAELTFLQNAADRIGAALQRAVASDAVRRAERRSRLLQNLATALSQAASTEEAAEQTLKAAVDWTSADRGLIAVPDEAGRMLHVVATIGFSPSDLGPAQRMDVEGRWGIAEVYRTGRTIHIADEEVWRTRYTQGYEVFGALGRSQFTQPLSVQGRTVGVMALLFTEERMLTADDRDLAEAFAAQAALALDRTRRYDAEHRAVLAFQRAMLPSHLDPAPGVTLSARYVPSSSHLEVGGDWYDVTTLPNGRLALAVGDVVGKGVESAAVMGQLRTAWRSVVAEGKGPADILDRLERFAETVPGAWCSTVLCAELEPWGRRVRIASAGHPPPLVVEGGATRFLDGGRSVPLLADPGARRVEAEHDVAAGSTLVLYTDGLVERRTRPLSDGLEALREAVAAGPADDVERLGDVVLGTMLEDGGSPDDAALLCVSLQTPLVLTFDADPAELRPLRSALMRWLRVGGVPDKVADDVVLAVHEAAANAVEHAYADAPPNGVSISVSRAFDGAVVSEVRDRGRWSDRASAPTRGRGLPLMSALMDDVTIDHAPDGTTVTLRVLPQEEER